MFSGNKAWNVLHRARSVKGVHGNKIIKDRWLQVFHVLLHSGGFILENPYCFSPLEQLIGFLIIERKTIWIKINVMSALHNFHGILNKGKGLETQKVHFKKAGTFYNRVIKLGHI